MTANANNNDILAASFKHGRSALAQDALTIPHNFYLFGDPIAHSMAPLLQNTLFADHSIPWTYSLFESVDTTAFVEVLKAPNCIGSAVTMPHKVTFMSQVDELTEEGTMIGSINTVFVRLHPQTKEKRYIGTNTDCIGVREALLQKYPRVVEESKGKPALVIGGGGACRSSVYALWRWFGASKIYLTNRIRSEVDGVIWGFKQTGFQGELLWVGSVEQAKALETPALVVGTIPDFSPREEGELVCRAITKEFLGREEKGVMLEMCYSPKPITALYKLAEAALWKVIDGTEAMVHQGIAQQMLWREASLEEFELKHTLAVIQDELEKRSLEDK